MYECFPQTPQLWGLQFRTQPEYTCSARNASEKLRICWDNTDGIGSDDRMERHKWQLVATCISEPPARWMNFLVLINGMLQVWSFEVRDLSWHNVHPYKVHICVCMYVCTEYYIYIYIRAREHPAGIAQSPSVCKCHTTSTHSGA